MDSDGGGFRNFSPAGDQRDRTPATTPRCIAHSPAGASHANCKLPAMFYRSRIDMRHACELSQYRSLSLEKLGRAGGGSRCGLCCEALRHAGRESELPSWRGRVSQLTGPAAIHVLD